MAMGLTRIARPPDDLLLDVFWAVAGAVGESLAFGGPREVEGLDRVNADCAAFDLTGTLDRTDELVRDAKSFVREQLADRWLFVEECAIRLLEKRNGQLNAAELAELPLPPLFVIRPESISVPGYSDPMTAGHADPEAGSTFLTASGSDVGRTGG